MKKTKTLLVNWEEGKSLYNQLPIIYKSGVKFNKLEVNCIVCSNVILQEDIKGNITWVSEYIVDMSVLCKCNKCNEINEFTVQVKDSNGLLKVEIENHACNGDLEKDLCDIMLNWLI